MVRTDKNLGKGFVLHIKIERITFNQVPLQFKSPEPKAAGELLGWTAVHCPSWAASSFSNEISDESAGQIESKLYL